MYCFRFVSIIKTFQNSHKQFQASHIVMLYITMSIAVKTRFWRTAIHDSMKTSLLSCFQEIVSLCIDQRLTGPATANSTTVAFFKTPFLSSVRAFPNLFCFLLNFLAPNGNFLAEKNQLRQSRAIQP